MLYDKNNLSKFLIIFLLFILSINVSYSLIITDNTIINQNYSYNTSIVLINITTNVNSSCKINTYYSNNNTMFSINQLQHTYNYILPINNTNSNITNYSYSIQCNNYGYINKNLANAIFSNILLQNPNINCVSGNLPASCSGYAYISGTQQPLGTIINQVYYNNICSAIYGAGYVETSHTIVSNVYSQKLQYLYGTTFDKFTGGYYQLGTGLSTLNCHNPNEIISSNVTSNQFSILGINNINLPILNSKPYYYLNSLNNTPYNFHFNILLMNTTFNMLKLQQDFKISIPNTNNYFFTNYMYLPNYYNFSLEMFIYFDINSNPNYLIKYGNKRYILKRVDYFLYLNGLSGTFDFGVLWNNLNSNSPIFLFNQSYLNSSLFQFIPQPLTMIKSNLIQTKQLPKTAKDISSFMSNLTPNLADFIFNLSLIIILISFIVIITNIIKKF